MRRTSSARVIMFVSSRSRTIGREAQFKVVDRLGPGQQ
jgi:hypothetical protein